MKVIATNGYKKNTSRSVEQTRQSHRPRSSCRACEAAFEDEVLANSVHAVCLTDRVAWFYDCFAAERSLASSTAATTIVMKLKKNAPNQSGRFSRMRPLFRAA
ncbi:hypothetical protein V466_26975 [Pseudomonas mandelii PD30]|uniref:Uncharacterized protein n=1 Tax=Pseudomonas mandelii PD30 TaxID=1419583 RepID=A0A059KV61_9PSED|nr:hypothetical protein V466_26975 [Pseudomonas mandelii PD30]